MMFILYLKNKRERVCVLFFVYTWDSNLYLNGLLFKFHKIKLTHYMLCLICDSIHIIL